MKNEVFTSEYTLKGRGYASLPFCRCVYKTAFTTYDEFCDQQDLENYISGPIISLFFRRILNLLRGWLGHDSRNKHDGSPVLIKFVMLWGENLSGADLRSTTWLTELLRQKKTRFCPPPLPKRKRKVPVRHICFPSFPAKLISSFRTNCRTST